MKNILYSLLILAFLLPSCKKSDEENSDTWTPEDEAFYNNVIGLQDQASENFETWIQTMDTTTALNQVQQFFTQNASVSSATVGEQGIAVEYTNGMRGGIFLNPMDAPDDTSLINSDLPGIPPFQPTLKSLVNSNKAIFINPSYWERSYFANLIMKYHNSSLPHVGFHMQDVYKNQEATIDRFTQLSGHGLIHVYSHGWAWPKEINILDVYLMTGEVTNLTATIKYWHDIKTHQIIISKTKNSSGWKNMYWINKDFIAGHNDFSQDTILFYGGFCYSFLGKWDQLYKEFAKGSYVGFTWSVYTKWNARWSAYLVSSLCDTTTRPPYTTEKWFNGDVPPKSYYDVEDMKTVYVKHVGDATLTFWQPPTASFSWTGSAMPSTSEICKGSSVTVQDKSLSPGFPITQWQWYFQNGTPNSYNGAQPPAIYFNTFGSGGIKLIVYNPLGTSTSEVFFSVVSCK